MLSHGALSIAGFVDSRTNPNNRELKSNNSSKQATPDSTKTEMVANSPQISTTKETVLANMNYSASKNDITA